MKPYQAVLFDFDYTLGDSSAAIVDCINFALRRMGYPAVADDAARRTIGMSITETFRELAGPQSEDHCRTFSRYFVERADEVMVAGATVYPEVEWVIPNLRRQGYQTGIVSTKFRHRIADILARHGLTGLFDPIVGGEEVARHKPAPDALLLALDRLDMNPEAVLYAGDSLIDAETARLAHTPFAAVVTGMTAAGAFAPYRPVGVFDSLSELACFLSED